MMLLPVPLRKSGPQVAGPAAQCVVAPQAASATTVPGAAGRRWRRRRPPPALAIEGFLQPCRGAWADKRNAPSPTRVAWPLDLRRSLRRRSSRLVLAALGADQQARSVMFGPVEIRQGFLPHRFRRSADRRSQVGAPTGKLMRKLRRGFGPDGCRLLRGISLLRRRTQRTTEGSHSKPRDMVDRQPSPSTTAKERACRSF